MSLVWEPPPPRNHTGGRKRVWDPLLTPLVENPGQWAKIKEFDRPKLANSCVQNLRRKIVRVPEGEWIFISRGSDVYACYIEGLPEADKERIRKEV